MAYIDYYKVLGVDKSASQDDGAQRPGETEEI